MRKRRSVNKISTLILTLTFFLTLSLVCTPGIAKAKDQAAGKDTSPYHALDTTGAVNIDYYHNAGLKAQQQAQANGHIGGISLDVYISHASIFTPEEKVYYNAAFGLK